MKKFFFGFLVCLVVLCALAWTPTDRMFNSNQFGTNNFSINLKSGVLLTNAVSRTPIFITPIGTNGTFYGGLSSRGDGSGSEIFGAGATAPGVDGTAVGRNSQANNENATALGEGSTVDANLGTALGAEAAVTGSAGTAVGGASSAEHGNSTALGTGTRTTAANQVRLGTATEHVSIPGLLQVTNNSVATTVHSNWVSTGMVNTADLTNSSLSDAIVVVDSGGKHLEMVVGSGLSYTAATRTLANTGGAGTDTNGISYVLTPGGELMPAIRTRNEGVTGSPVVEILHTNGVQFIALTNHGDGSSGWVIRDDTGYDVLKSTLSGSGEAYLGGGSVLGLNLGVTPLALWTGSQLRINDLTGATALDHTDKDAPILGPYTFDLGNWEDGGTVYRDGTVIRASNAVPVLNVVQANIGNMYVTNRLTVTNSIRQPFFELASTGNATNYTVDWAATVADNRTINATGNVYFAVIAANLVGGVTKQYVITNVYNASSNITIYAATNLGWLHGQTYTLGASPMHTNYAIPCTNRVVLNFQSTDDQPRNILSFFVHNQP